MPVSSYLLGGAPSRQGWTLHGTLLSWSCSARPPPPYPAPGAGWLLGNCGRLWKASTGAEEDKIRVRGSDEGRGTQRLLARTSTGKPSWRGQGWPVNCYMSKGIRGFLDKKHCYFYILQTISKSFFLNQGCYNIYFIENINDMNKHAARSIVIEIRWDVLTS